MKQSPIRTAVYCRVSTSHAKQEESMENQMRHYEERLENDDRYELIQIYYDFGISGFKENRPGFQQMLRDARMKRFDYIITKSITRFARNTLTMLQVTRMLKELGIGVFFELQGIHTLSNEGELMMTLYACFGQAESEGNRKLTQMARQREYQEGRPIVMAHRSLGYAKDETGALVPDKDAPMVRMIFEMAYDGRSISAITRHLNDNGFQTKNRKPFYRATVRRILQNEIYKGDYVCQKHYVDENRQMQKNKGERPMYYIKNHHEPIVDRGLWDDVQERLWGCKA